jgi:hypothetical protein
MTATLTANIDAEIQALVSHPRFTDAEIVAALDDVQVKAQDAVASLTAPMTHDQRKALFAAFTDVFGQETKNARKVFTRLALGRPSDAPVSWAQFGDRNGQGALTAREASIVLDALTALDEAL